MEYISVLTFVSALIYLGAGVYTFAKNKEGGVTQHFLLLSLFLSMWAFAASFAIAAPSEAKVFFWYNSFSFTWFLFPPVLVHFFLSLTQKNFSFRFRHILLYLPGFILLFATQHTTLIIKNFVRGPLGWFIIYNHTSFWYIYNICHYSLAMLISLIILLRWFKGCESTEKCHQAGITLFTFLPAVLLSTVTGTILPILGIFELPPLAPIFMTIWVIGIAIGVTKFKMMIPTPQNSAVSLIETIHESVLLLDKNSHIVFANPAFSKLTGYSPSQLSNVSIDTFLSEPICSGTAPLLLFRKEGNAVPVEATSTSIYTERKDEIGRIVVFKDKQIDERLLQEIKLRKETAEQLHYSEILFTKAFYLSPIGMIIVDNEDYRIIEVNDALLANFGYDRSVTEAKKITDFPVWAHDSDRRAVFKILNQGKTVRNMMVALLHHDGFPVESKFSAEKMAIGDRELILFCVDDISSRINLERQVMKMQRMESLGFLAGSVAHDLNNIFTAIEGNLDIARHTLPNDEEEVKEALDAALYAYEKGKRLVRTVLQHTRVKEDMQTKINIRDVLEAADQLAFRASTVKRTTKAPSGFDPFLAGYPDLLFQLFMNLFINARQAMNNMGELLIELSGDEDTITISVCDDGPGVPERYADQIFDKAFSTREEGTGLGLSIVRSIVERHKGTILLDKRYTRGAKFIVTLPRKIS
ncbi:ATP-binding protein [Sediminispirochaeta smaragdinae]|uniref:histidine kinase n=1 Tax=Sediminispirochaeta smaragdinae (strain DSM 11293 / JCM 15392 / SEBR 4228) TaxID=573413 RepID=E1R719_SEDSS|nr:ATP-binding protein [Sediminispirochaeta smaragdinae]ADK81346.1 multi-sensor signal transduction histidine kinase [Sediminispirochaeta smaragdinae DSM 11293]